jgi:hypothetical protein
MKRYNIKTDNEDGSVLWFKNVGAEIVQINGEEIVDITFFWDSKVELIIDE